MVDAARVTVFLLKNHESVLKYLSKDHKKYEISEKGTFYYDTSEESKPLWIEGFFQGKLRRLGLSNQSSKGVLIHHLKIDGQEKYFALPFGYGHSMIDKSDCVSDFGLKIVLNVVDKIRRVERRTLSTEPKQTIEQLSKIGDITDFGIDIEQDLVEEVTGRPKDSDFGSALVGGKVGFTATVEVTLSNLDKYLQTCLKYYKKTDYKKRFSFIDQIKETTDTDPLNKLLIKKLLSPSIKDIKIWMAIPEIVSWESLKGVSYFKDETKIVNDLDLGEFLTATKLQNNSNLTIEDLKKKRIYHFNNNSTPEVGSWSAFNCLYCELKYKNATFLLSNGRWYEIAKGFVQEVEASYRATMRKSISLKFIDCKKGEKEGPYNKRLATNLKAVLMDRRNISYGGGHSSIELCDVYDAKKKSFIHVKDGQSSSTLSHLFAQGRVSGQLFLHDAQFRDKAKAKNAQLPMSGRLKPQAKDYQIVFGIIEGSDHELNIPFFSKVNFRDTKRTLTSVGWTNIYITKIQRLK